MRFNIFHKEILKNIKFLWLCMPKIRKKQFTVVLILSLFNTFLDLISIGSVVPLLIFISNPSKISNSPLLSNILNYTLSFYPSLNLFVIFIIFFISITVISFFSKLLFIRLSLKTSYSFASDIGVLIYTNIINKPYEYHIASKSSKIITALGSKVNVIAFHVIYSALIFISSLFVVIGIVISLFIINPLTTLYLLGFFIILYGFFGILVHKKLEKNSIKIQSDLDSLLKLVQDSLGSIRDIILDNSLASYIEEYGSIDSSMRQTQSLNSFIGNFPRLIIENLGIILLLVFILFLYSNNKNLSDLIPTLGAIVFTLQKILPSFHGLFSSWSSISGEQATLSYIAQLLTHKQSEQAINSIPANPKINFINTLKLKNVCFSYNSRSPLILKNINLNIRKGSKIALLGPSGSGKSTLVDILMGLLKPTEGGLYVDNDLLSYDSLYLWRKKVSHVPQDIFLIDASIAENIAFGVPLTEINFKKINNIIKQIKMKDFIDKLELKLLHQVGERGINLSGGQKQKIAIARAIYKDASLIVFDEATSSLDPDAQNDIINLILNLNDTITVVVITHQISLVKNFELIYMLNNGTLVKT